MLNSKPIISKIFLRIPFVALPILLGLTSCGGGGDAAAAAPAPAPAFCAANAAVGIVSVPTATTDISIIAPSLVASRITGVAPLAVFFDASATTTTVTTVPATRPFHDLEYTWHFGDHAGGATWACGSQTAAYKNAAKGPIAAHVFETEGTFEVTLTVFNGTNTVTKKATITVTNPNTVFAATTRYFYRSTPDAGVSTVLQTQASTNLSADISTAITAGARRILLKRGDTFTTPISVLITAAGPGILGAYGAASAVPVITSSAASGSVLRVNVSNDWRIMDILLTRSAAAGITGINIANVVSDITILRVTTIGVSNGMTSSPGSPRTVVQDSIIGTWYAPVLPSSGWGIFIVSEYLAVMGTLVDMNNGSNGIVDGVHGIRSQSNYVILSNNTWTAFPGLSYRGNSQYGVVSDNKFTVGTRAVGFQPSGFDQAHWVRDVIFERNMLINSSMHMAATDITVRNNIFNSTQTGTFSATNSSYVSIEGLSPRPNNLHIYNNSIRSLSTSTSIGILHTSDSPVNSTSAITLKNNLVYSPNSATPVLIGGSGSPTLTASNNTLTNAGMKIDPLFTNGSTTFSLTSDFTLPATGSYGVNTGVVVPGNYTAFDGTARPTGSAVDMGAFER